ncbi:50S ribosomal protein L32 [Pseudonocardia adelaidensis]|uniref:50S ribosomal protein L32 n=1 Tax=Pseudonocardia adelaidensis TaxID=648754 RepID=UPI003CD052F7
MSSSMFRKKSRSRVRHHRAQWHRRMSVPQLAPCPNPRCRQVKPAHVLCPACGQHRGRQVLSPTRD